MMQIQFVGDTLLVLVKLTEKLLSSPEMFFSQGITKRQFKREKSELNF